MRRERKKYLTEQARQYIGTLVAEVINTYTAFEDLPPEEQDFMDDYIRKFGHRVYNGGRG